MQKDAMLQWWSLGVYWRGRMCVLDQGHQVQMRGVATQGPNILGAPRREIRIHSLTPVILNFFRFIKLLIVNIF